MGNFFKSVGSFLGNAIPFLGPITSIFSAKSAKDTNTQSQASAREAMEFEAAQSAKQMDFQERMSNTAHTREVADLKNAGLNPILSANGGASTPTGAMGGGKTYTPENPAKDLPTNVMNSARLAADLALTREMTNTQKSQQVLNAANAAKTSAETQVIAPGGNLIRRGINAGKRLVAWSARPIGGAIGNMVTPQISAASARRIAINNAYDNKRRG